jgi:hypothetical protein
MLTIKPKRPRPYPPRTTGKAERCVPPFLREWAKGQGFRQAKRLLEWPRAAGYAKLSRPPEGPPHACLSAIITIITGLPSASTDAAYLKDPKKQPGEPRQLCTCQR